MSLKEKIDFESFVLNGCLGNVKIGTEKKYLDSAFGFEELGEFDEAYYLDSMLQCYFDKSDSIERFKLKVGNSGSYKHLQNMFYNIGDLFYKDEFYFSLFFEKKNVRSIIHEPVYFDDKKITGCITSSKNITIIVDHEAKQNRFQKDRVTLYEIWIDNGFQWQYELDILSGNYTNDSMLDLKKKYFSNNHFH